MFSSVLETERRASERIQALETRVDEMADRATALPAVNASVDGGNGTAGLMLERRLEEAEAFFANEFAKHEEEVLVEKAVFLLSLMITKRVITAFVDWSEADVSKRELKGRD